ncbi:unnamed protein product [Hyaloperonospora brassicae]|uniref:VASt domain-containing protein n=1 Tax=Hyaloperonospora brassicae TaxID=162125 RepID=A0AAV0T1K4_HYABA|nr:unnamed protein product [Hyaloperonospora brassicae]
MKSPAALSHKDNTSATREERSETTATKAVCATSGVDATDPFQAFTSVSRKATNSVQLCHAVSMFVTDRADVESAYAQALLQLTQNVKAEDWSKQFTECWDTFCSALEHLAQVRRAFALTMQMAIVQETAAFAEQHEKQVHRLITEGTDVHRDQQRMATLLDKARKKYDSKCQEAIEIIAMMRRSDSVLAGNANSSLLCQSSSEEVSAPKDRTEKLATGAGHLLTKMWDSRSAFGRNPLERQRAKLCGCLEEVIAMEKLYLGAVECTNAQRLDFDRKIRENLDAFQLTEERRLEYLRDMLMRMQQAFIDIFPQSQQVVEQMKTNINRVNETVDLEKSFESSASQEEVDIDQADLSINPFYLRMTHIQAMSDDGQRMIRTIKSVLAELIAGETYYLQSLHKLLRTHEVGGLSPTSNHFVTSSSSEQTSFVGDEGKTIVKGWMAVKDQVKLIMEVHQEFQSLLVEPVSLSLDTMKSEYESTRVSAQKDFLKLHSTLCNETSAHRRLQQELDKMSRNFVTAYTNLSGSAAADTTFDDIDVSQALKALSDNARLFDEKEDQPEAKIRQVADEIRQSQAQVLQSTNSLRQTYETYVQEIGALILVYKRNEKYRLQVAKYSLQSLAKAIEHTICGSLSVGKKAMAIFEKIDPSKDAAMFIRTDRQPLERSKEIVATHHGNDSLNDVMQNYLASRGESLADALENTDAISCSSLDSTYIPISISGAPPLPKKLSALSSTPLAGDGKAPSEKDNLGGDVMFDADDNACTERDEGFVEAQPLEVSDFQKKFKLDEPEEVIGSFSCALFLSNFPFHGRLYLTKSRMCFSGWIETIFVASFSDITLMEKKNTALIVPNAIEFTVKEEKVFFASFVYRDECFQSILQIRSIQKETEALMSDLAKRQEKTSRGAESESEANPDSRWRRVSDELVAIASATDARHISIGTADAMCTEERIHSPSFSVNCVTSDATPIVLEKDVFLDEYDLLLNEQVAFSVDTAFSTLWIESDTFFCSLLHAAGSTSVSLSPWKKGALLYAAVSKPDTFQSSRLVTYTHNKKYMVGPSVIPTTQTQRYAYTPGTRLVVSTTTSISNVPYCDHFRIEHRWVFSATKKKGTSLAQVGLRVRWLKNTWLKKQIESTTVSESKDALKMWLSAALDATKELDATESSARSPDRARVNSSKSVGRREEHLPKSTLQHGAACTDSPAATLAHAESAPTLGLLTPLHSTLQIAIVLCTLMFAYTMYRMCAAMDEMQTLTRESLRQQRDQYELLKTLLYKRESRYA